MKLAYVKHRIVSVKINFMRIDNKRTKKMGQKLGMKNDFLSTIMSNAIMSENRASYINHRHLFQPLELSTFVHPECLLEYALIVGI